ncbi:hypothetical protein [Planobispora rosea]|uniref:hypothetical protein n=1 Tax=Planobispora rosea TaxID=35762 RepID=UPI00083AADDC|nr:hypothetical protein [Planobispora rosea]
MQQSHPYDDKSRFEVEAKLNLTGDIEFLGVRHYPDGRPPTSEIKLFGIPVSINNTDVADRFAHAAQVMADQLHIAHTRRQVARGMADPQ